MQNLFIVKLIFKVLCWFWLCHKRIVPFYAARTSGECIDYSQSGVRSDLVPHHDSNVELLLRTELFYPLNYGGKEGTKENGFTFFLCSDELMILRSKSGATNLFTRLLARLRKHLVHRLVIGKDFPDRQTSGQSLLGLLFHPQKRG